MSLYRVCLFVDADEFKSLQELSVSTEGIAWQWCQGWENLQKMETGLDVLLVDLDLIGVEEFEGRLEQLKSRFVEAELIALSSNDSGVLAIKCIRNGFTDFLLKPVSGEELLFIIKKALQNIRTVSNVAVPEKNFSKITAQISMATSPNLVYLQALQFFNRLFAPKSSYWLETNPKNLALVKLNCFYPHHTVSIKRLNYLVSKGQNLRKDYYILFSKKHGRSLVLQSGHFPNYRIVLLGIQQPISKKKVGEALTLWNHCLLTLLNLNKYEEIKKQTFLDDLTGLFNARYLRYAVSSAVQKHERSQTPFSILFVDVDHFKRVNDTHNHLTGSALLATIARTIKHSVRKFDLVFRYGGDEFVVLLNMTACKGAFEIAERIRKNIERRVFVIQGVKIKITVSIGVATYPLHTQDKEVLLRLADQAMYSAKKQARNCVHLAVTKSEDSKLNL